MGQKREKFYTVSARLVFSGILAAIIAILILGASSIINKGPIFPLLGIGMTTITPGEAAQVTCSPYPPYGCSNGSFNYTTGILSVAISQSTGYSWSLVTVRFVPSNTIYSQGVPVLSWSPPQAVNVTGGLPTNTIKYVNIPISSGPVAIGTNITGSIWAKYQLNVGGGVSYANISSAYIVVRRAT